MTFSKQEQGIVIQVIKKLKDIDMSTLKIKKLAKAICNRFVIDESQETRYEINIAIVDDNEIRKLNKQFLNSESTTDCLSFDSSNDQMGPKIYDLVVNGEMAVRQANQRGHSSEAELALYITHGLLHNLGFDDSTKKQARKMHETEDKILQEFGYGIVYNKSIKSKEH